MHIILGLSCKSQEIYLIVFLVRYSDLFMYFVSVYNTSMKIFFITATALIIYLMKYKVPYCTTYDSLGDQFPHFKVLIPVAAVLTCILNTGWTPWTWFWSFSIWLEAIAFVPQIVMLHKMRVVENLTSHYVAALGLYRFFYILNWIYRYQVEGFFCWTQTLAALLQTGLYIDFLYYYFKSVKEGKPVRYELPV